MEGTDYMRRPVTQQKRAVPQTPAVRHAFWQKLQAAAEIGGRHLPPLAQAWGEGPRKRELLNASEEDHNRNYYKAAYK